MKRNFIIFFVIYAIIFSQFFFCLSVIAQNVGINTLTPQARLHIFKGNSGYIGVYPHQDLIIESNDNAWINILAPNNKETGLLFGKPSNIASGGIVYDINNNLHFRTNGNINRMFIGSNGNIGVGTTAPNAPLSFPAALGNKITLYPGASGNVGFGVQGNLFQMFSDYSGADIAFGYGSSSSFIERMRIKGTGNVGIGTSLPTQKLEVDGHIVISGSYLYKTAKTFYYSISPETFTGRTEFDRVFKDGVAYLEGGNIMYAPINLPHQAVITEVKVYYEDVSFPNDIIVELYRKFKDGSWGSPEIMFNFTSFGTPGATWVLINGINNPIIDNSNYTYALRVRSESSWPGSDLLMKGVFITYTLSSAQ